MIKKLIISLFLILLDVSGINALCRWLNREKAIILCYHGICNDGFNLLKGYDERHIPKSIFRRHLDYLKRKGYTFVNMTELSNIIKNKERTDKLVVLTFDDGFRNVIDNAYQLMQQFGAKGCFYLVSDLTGTKQILWTDRVETVIRNQNTVNFQFVFKGESINYALGDKHSKERAMEDIKKKLRTLPDKERHKHLEQFPDTMLGDIPGELAMAEWQQIRELDADTIEIGSHTRRHPNCGNLTSLEELEDEIVNSKIIIEKNIHREVKHFCYPASSFDDRTIAKVMACGYASAVTLRDGLIDHKSDLYRLNRIGTGEHFLRFKACVSGSYAILQRMKDTVCFRRNNRGKKCHQPAFKPL